MKHLALIRDGLRSEPTSSACPPDMMETPSAQVFCGSADCFEPSYRE